MIKILGTAEKDEGIFIRLRLGYPVDQCIDFYRAGGTELETRLLLFHLQDQLKKMCQELRKISYHRGWRDAKSKKKAKEKNFDTLPTIQDWERKS